MDSLAALLAAIEQGAHPDYLLFWGHRQRAAGQIGKSCLSQWYPAPFHEDGRYFATAEHYMMHGKAVLFGDAASAAAVLATSDPAQAKALGRGIQGFDEQRWQAARMDIVLQANWLKFSQNPALGRFLLGTGAQVLVEASPVDRIWGIGLAADAAQARDPARWRGLNLLGFALMQVRQRLLLNPPLPAETRCD